jgi:hypothetical protein
VPVLNLGLQVNCVGSRVGYLPGQHRKWNVPP